MEPRARPPRATLEGAPDDGADGLEGRFGATIDRLLAGARPAALGVAVSGGGDSMALLHLAARWGGTTLRVATVEHGLRTGAEAEARLVASRAAALGLGHDTLRWRWDGAGNLQAAAREGRRAALAAWARDGGLAGVLLGHTLDDQAETLLMRLARGSGVEGLAAMDEGAHGRGLFLRPLLGERRDALRAWLRSRGEAWTEDPSNEDARFERVRARRTVAAMGLDPARLAATAARMGRAREALERRALDVARALGRPAMPGDVALDRAGLAAVEEDTRLRVLAGALRHVSGAPYRPREADLLRLARASETRTLHGCVVRDLGATLLVHREPAAVAGLRSAPGEPWDGAWTLDGPPGSEVRALGEEGLRLTSRPDDPPGASERSTAAGGTEPAPAGAWTEDGVSPPPGHPRAALAARPALWRGGDLLGFAPLRHGVPHPVRWHPPGGAFPDCLLTRDPAPGARPGPDRAD